MLISTQIINKPTIAVNTLSAIENAIARDQGAAYRGWLGRVLPHIGDAYREEESPFRTHLGASVIGRECAREIWYGFRWTTRTRFGGRMLRLFNRGHLEEGRFIALLLLIGCQVYQQDENGNQFVISGAEGHFGGSGDGIVVGLPDLAPGQAALLECKTHSEKSYKEVAAKGVQEAKPEHYTQMQVYMRKMGLAVALYMAVNKNNDDIYLELVTLDKIHADLFIERGEKMVWLDTAPEKLRGSSAGFWKCRFCDHKGVCHQSQEPDRNCRTCVHSKPVEGKQWVCTINEPSYEILPKEKQFVGCEKYARNPGI